MVRGKLKSSPRFFQVIMLLLAILSLPREPPQSSVIDLNAPNEQITESGESPVKVNVEETGMSNCFADASLLSIDTHTFIA